TVPGYGRVFTGQSRNNLRGSAACLVVALEGFLDAAVPHLLMAVDAPGVDPQQHVNAVPSATRDLGRRHTGVQGERDTTVAEVVRSSGERRGHLGRRERLLSGHLPDAPVHTLGERPTAPTGEQAAVRSRPVLVQVATQQPDEFRRDGYRPSSLLCSVLQ